MLENRPTSLHPGEKTKQPNLATFRRLGQFGRLGNQLFQIAATIGIARANGMAYAFPAWQYEDYFANRLPRLTSSHSMFHVHRERTFLYDEMHLEQNTDLLGYFQSERYFQNCSDEIRSVFQFPDWLIRKSLGHFGELIRGNCCSMHVRRGDYVTNSSFTDLSATDYYETALSKVEAVEKTLVFSDDIPFCRDRFQGTRFHFSDSGSVAVDLFLMSQCKAHIIANSSFSWWGAWLNPNPRKQVIAPRHWFIGPTADPTHSFIPGPPHRGFHDTGDLLPGDWALV